MSPEEMARLRKAVRGLLFSSQIDAPFKVVSYPADDDRTAEQVLQLPAGAAVEEIAAGTFFAELTHIEKWHAEDDRAVIRRYRELAQVLRETLRDVRVFRVGTGRVSIHVVGRSRDGSWAGIEAVAVEP